MTFLAILFGRLVAFGRSHPKVVYVGALALVAAGAFGAGYYARPGKVVTQTVVKTETVFKDRVVTVEKRVADRKVHRVVVVREVPGKERVVTITTDVGARTTTNVDTTATERGATSTASSSTRTETREPQWLVTGLAGVTIARGLAPTPFVGAGVSRRVLGPVWAGVVAGAATDAKSGFIGVSLSGSF